MRLFAVFSFFMFLFLACAGVNSNKFSVLAYRQKVIPGAAPDMNSAAEFTRFRYYLFLLPKKNSNQIRINQLCLDERIYGADLESLSEPYITEPIFGPEGFQRDTLLPQNKLPAYLIHLKKPETEAGNNKAVCKKNELVLQLNIGKVTINKWTDLPDQIMP